MPIINYIHVSEILGIYLISWQNETCQVNLYLYYNYNDIIIIQYSHTYCYRLQLITCIT